DRGEGLPQPGKIYAGSPGTLLLTNEERAIAYRQEKTDVIMSVKAIDEVWNGMTGGREVPPYMKHLQLGDYTGVKDVYISFGGDEVFLAGAQSIKKRLEEFGAHVTLEVGEGMYHSYAMMPMVSDAGEGHGNYINYLSR
ncbi:MAG: alpha/beta hydrolase fold domain-containing protein, partial [Ruminococcus sp.]|nr:alpha/beta hydrolase fold domain-containing protein [Ruminococcus sp.]